MVSAEGTMADLSVVWAKIKGYPWWPATVNLSHLSKGELLQESPNKFKVFFVGETTQYDPAVTAVPSSPEVCFGRSGHTSISSPASRTVDCRRLFV